VIPPPGLIQESLGGDPWRVAVACALLNRTTGRQVRPLLPRLLARWPDPASMAAADPRRIGRLLRPLGLWRRRRDLLRRLSADAAAGMPPEDWFGVGKYAMDAVRRVCRGDLTARPEDKELRSYKARLLRRAREGERCRIRT